MYLLDTNVISELRRSGRAHPGVAQWASEVSPAALHLSVITVLEIERGILLLQRRDKAQAALIQYWFETQVLPAFSGRILSVDVPAARACARLHVPDPVPERDAMIAAAAIVHGLTLVTRNVADFDGTGVAVFNPWAV
jgi:predicted nucleic acid-binding protein